MLPGPTLADRGNLRGNLGDELAVSRPFVEKGPELLAPPLQQNVLVRLGQVREVEDFDLAEPVLLEQPAERSLLTQQGMASAGGQMLPGQISE